MRRYTGASCVAVPTTSTQRETLYTLVLLVLQSSPQAHRGRHCIHWCFLCCSPHHKHTEGDTVYTGASCVAVPTTSTQRETLYTLVLLVLQSSPQAHRGRHCIHWCFLCCSPHHKHTEGDTVYTGASCVVVLTTSTQRETLYTLVLLVLQSSPQAHRGRHCIHWCFLCCSPHHKHTEGDTVFAITCVDITIEYFQFLIQELFAECMNETYRCAGLSCDAYTV